MDSCAVRGKESNVIYLLVKNQSETPPAESTKATGTTACISAGETAAMYTVMGPGVHCWIGTRWFGPA